jgi:predicted esterase
MLMLHRYSKTRTFRLHIILITFALSLLGTIQVVAQQVAIDADIEKKTFTFATRDSTALQLDVYHYSGTPASSPCIMFVFGGGFIRGSRDARIYNRYFNALVKNKYVVISISYRLGMQGAKRITPFRVKPLRNAIAMAVEDLYDATNWTLKNAHMLGVDPSKIILSGSSAGAITILQADYEKCNNHEIAKVLPENFRYAGVIAFAGGILSFNGALKYRDEAPAPTMLFHGTEDKLVIYNKIRFLHKGFYGSSHIAKVFRKKKYPYYIYRETGMGHESSYTPLNNRQQEILWFIEEYILNKKPYLMDISFDDLQKVRTMHMTRDALYER